MNVLTLFARRSSSPALVHVQSSGVTRTRTFAELLTRIGNLGAGLRRLGVAERHRVLILSGTLVETLESILGVMNIGAVAMPVSTLLGTQGLVAIIARMQPACCIFEDPPGPEVRAALARTGCRLISIKPTRHAVGNWHDYEKVLAEPREAGIPDFDDTHPALIMHSSGSEGEPKPIAFSHGELRVFLEHNAIHHAQFRESDIADAAAFPLVSVLPLSHLGGLSACLQGLLVASPTWLLSFFVPETYLRVLQACKARMTILVPSMYRSLLKNPRLSQTDLSHVRFCLTLGEPCTAGLAREIATAFGATVVSAYGMTECLSGLGHSREDLNQGRIKPGSCGTHCFGDLRLVDEHGNDHPSRGELWVRNPTVHACYLDPQLDGACCPDGWFRTKDVFFRDPDGHFFHCGRRDDMFICNGKNVYPVELERVLLGNPVVEAACVAPVTGRENTTLTAALVRTSQPVTESQIMEFCARNGPTHAVPRVVRFMEELPEIGPGKLDRKACRELLQETYDSGAA